MTRSIRQKGTTGAFLGRVTPYECERVARLISPLRRTQAPSAQPLRLSLNKASFTSSSFSLRETRLVRSRRSCRNRSINFGICSRNRVDPYMQPRIFFSCKKAGLGMRSLIQGVHANNRTRAARPQDIKRLGRSRRNANRFKRVLDPLATRNLHDGLIKIIGLGIDCMGRSKTRSHVEFRVDDVYRDDFAAPAMRQP